jgi:hypothetical protein
MPPTLPPSSARWLTPDEIRTQAGRGRHCDEDHCRSGELRIAVTIYQRPAGQLRAYEHLYCERHGKLAAVWRNVRLGPPPGEDTPEREP